MPSCTSHRGFVLLEVVTTLILLGVIGTFASLFLWNGINGYLTSKRNAETALAAQVALDRISSELRHITSLPVAPTADSITYRTTDLPGTRKLSYAAGKLYLKIDTSNDYLLLDNLSAFRLALDAVDLDNDGANNQEVSAIRVGFNVNDVPTPFDVRVYPRSFIPKP
jgi:prepilin-type N-terminal cleavage/methylation domain-containing protein